MKCPNKNTKEWKQLVALFGDTNSMLAYVRNNEEIPSILGASKLLEHKINLNKRVNTSLRLKVTQEVIDNINKNPDPIAALEELIINKSTNNFHKAVFKLLRPNLEEAVKNKKFLGFFAENYEDSSGAVIFTDQGYFVNLTPGVLKYSSDYYTDMSYILLHELAHVVTIFPILADHANKRGYFIDLPEAMQKPLAELHKLFNYVKSKTPLESAEFQKYSHAFKDEKEFVAFALSNEEFAEYLNSIKYNNKSILSRILNALKELFNFLVPGSALDALLDITNELILQQKGNNTLVSDVFSLVDVDPTLFTDILLKKENLTTNDNSNFYTDGVVKKLRTSNVVKELSPYVKNSERGDEYFEDVARASFRNKGLAVTDVYQEKTVTGLVLAEYTFDEYVVFLKKKMEQPRLIGKAMHALYVSKKLSGIDNIRSLEYQREFEKYIDQLGLSEDDVKDIETRVDNIDKLLASEFLGTDSLTQYEYILSLDTSEFTYEAEKMLGIGGTADIIVDHGESVYSIFDIKTGELLESAYLKDTTLIKYAREAGLFMEDNALNRYSLSMALYAMMIKKQDPKAKFNTIKLLHIPKNTNNKEAVAINLGEALLVLAKYFEANHPEFYSDNKYLFSPKNYITQSSDVNIGIEAKKLEGFENAKEAYKKELIVKFRTLVSSRSRFEEKKASARTEGENEKYAKILTEYQKVLEQLIELEVGTQPFKEKGFKNLNFMQAIFLNRYNSKNILIRTLNNIYSKRKVAFDKEYLWSKKEQRKYLQDVLKEARAKKRAPLLGSDYKYIFDFIWDNGNMTTYKSAKWKNLTDSQKKYADYHRWIIRLNLFATMSPMNGVNFIETELKTRKDLTPENVKLLETHIAVLKNLPDYSKFYDYKALRNFQYFEGWTPRMAKRPEEVNKVNAQALKEYAKLSLKDAEILSDQEFINTIYPSEYESTLGIAPKFFGSYENNAEKQNLEEYTWNAEFIFDAFTNNMLQKRYFDDVYSIGLGIRTFMEDEDRYAKRKANVHNIKFIDSFLKGTVLKKPTDMFNMTIKIGSREFKIDAFARKLRSYMGVTTLAVNILGAATAGISQTIRTINQAIAGTLVKIFLGTDKEKDMTVSDTAKAFKEVLAWKTAQMPYKLKKDDLLLNNKLHLMLQEWDYLPKSYIYEDAYNSAGLTSQNLILPTWVNNETLLKLYSSVDNVNYATYLVGQLMHHKVNKTTNGVTKKVSLWEAYEVRDGQLVYTGDTRGVDRDTGETISELTYKEIDKLRALAERDLGSYRSDERSYMDNSTLGALFMMFKRWLPAMAKRAFSDKFDNYTLGEYMATQATVKDIDGYELPELEWTARSDEGYIRSLFSSLNIVRLLGKDLMTKGPNSEYSKLSYEQKKNVIYALTKVMSYVGLYIMFVSLFGEDVDDDDKNGIKRAAARIKDETVFEFILFPTAQSLDDWKRVITSFPALDKAITTLDGYLTLISGVGKESILGLDGQRLQSGPYKGWYKGMVPSLRGTKYASTIFGLFEFEKAYKDVNEDLQRLQ